MQLLNFLHRAEKTSQCAHSIKTMVRLNTTKHPTTPQDILLVSLPLLATVHSEQVRLGGRGVFLMKIMVRLNTPSMMKCCV